MTDHAAAGTAGPTETGRVVSERVVQRDCAGCGTTIRYTGRGRPARYCRPACRQRDWALRHAEQALGTPGDTRPQVIREVLERVIEREHRVLVSAPTPPPATPTHAQGWMVLLGQLTEHLAEPATALVREHWHHRRLHDALARAVHQLDATHPGGLGRPHRR